MAYDNMTDPKTYIAGNPLTAAELNSYQRDNQDAMFPGGDDYDTWSPSYTNLTVGNGTVVARYLRLGHMVHFRWSFILGSSSSVGTGPRFTLPVEAAADYVDFYILGGAMLREIGGAIYRAHVRFNDTSRTEVELRYHGTNAASTAITSSAPFTWGTGDVLAADGSYEVA